MKKQIALFLASLLLICACAFVFIACNDGGQGIDGDEFQNVTVTDAGILSWTKLNRAKKYEILNGKFGTGAPKRETTDCSFDLSVFSLSEGRNYVTLLGIEDNSELGETVEMEFAVYEMVVEIKSGVYSLYARSFSDEYLSLNGYEDKDGVITKYIQPQFYSSIGGATYTSMPKDIRINGDNVWGLYSDSEYRTECGSQTITGLKTGHNYYYIKLNDKNGTFLKGYKIDFYILDKIDVVLYSKTGEKLYETNVWEMDSLAMSTLYSQVGANDYIAYGFEPIERDVASVEIQKSTSFRVISADEYTVLKHFTFSYDGVLSKKQNHTCDGIETLTIPAKLCGYDVVTIGDGENAVCNIKNLTIENGIRKIAKNAFRNSSLTTVSLPASVVGIGAEAFYGCSSLQMEKYGDDLYYLGDWLIDCNRNPSGTSVTLKPTTVGIACSNFPFVDFAIPDTLRSLTYPNVFSYAVNRYEQNTHAENYNGLIYFGKWLVTRADKSAAVPALKDDTVGILSSVFYGTKSTDHIVIPASVTYIAPDAFYYSGVTDITVSCTNYVWENGLLLDREKTMIYYVSPAVEELTIPDSVTSIGYSNALARSFSKLHIGAMFRDLPSDFPKELVTITVSPLNTEYRSESNILCKKNNDDFKIAYVPKNISGNVVIPSFLTMVSESSFRDCKNITGVVIPDGVRMIGFGAFWGCTSLSSVTIPNSVTSISANAFADCTSLTGVTLPNGIREVGGFSGCTSLTGIIIPDGVETIARDAFADCTSLASVTIPNSVESIQTDAFKNCTSLGNITIPNSVRYLSGFAGCTFVSFTIPNSVEYIVSDAFKNCTALASINIPSSVTEIDNSAFEGCTALTAINVPEGVKSIGNWVFKGCSNLATITLPNTLESIGYAAFHDCASLTSLKIPANVKDISAGIVNKGCTSLTGITFANPNGWKTDRSGTAIDASVLSDPKKAMELLSDEYAENLTKRS